MFPRWLSWLFVACLAVMLYQVARAPRPAPDAPITIENHAYPALTQVADGEHWKSALNPDYAKLMAACQMHAPAPGQLGVKITIEAVGNGEVASCGEPVTLEIQAWDATGKNATTKTLTVTPGKIGIAALDSALVGMKFGEERTVILPPIAPLKKGDVALRAIGSASQLRVLSVRRVQDAQP
ncbi:MAG: hypothetical protein ACKVOE_07575 [Rickettsiales bacterium]